MEAQTNFSSPSSTAEQALHRFQAAFPQLPAEVLRDILTACEGNVSHASALLSQMLAGASPDDAIRSSEATTAAASTPRVPFSTAQLYGSHQSTCGYCHSPLKTRTSFGMECARLTVQDYQALIDLGWRRSGDYLYKQDNTISCCANYTIRLNVHKFQRSKAQRHALNRFERFLKGETIGGMDKQGKRETKKGEEKEGGEMKEEEGSAMTLATPTPAPPADPHADRLLQALLASIQALVTESKLPSSLAPDTYEKQVRVYPYVEPKSKKGKKTESSGKEAAASTASSETAPTYHYTSNSALVLSGILRKQKADLPAPQIAHLLVQQLPAALASLPAPADSSSTSSSSSSSVQAHVAEPLGYINFVYPGAQPLVRSRAHSLEGKKGQPHNKGGQKPKESSSQTAASSSSSSSSLPPHTFEIRQVPATFNEEAFQVYKKYQMAVHKDEESELKPSQYKRFLCNSPLSEEGPYGGFHHHYLLDGKIIAVGVVDILPICLSSVYLFYDPAYEFLNLGTVTALKEIEWVAQKLTPHYPHLKYYYMGYYIYSCQKMRYKGAYVPSELLCPMRFTWHPLAECLPALESLETSMATAAAAAADSSSSASSSSPNHPAVGRCVIFSDVCYESREEDGSLPTYLSPSLVQRKYTSPRPQEAQAANSSSGEKKTGKEKKRKESKRAEETKQEDEEMRTEGAASESSSSSPFPLISPSSPYVFSLSSQQSARAHAKSVAQQALPLLPISLRGGHRLFGKLPDYIQVQVKKVLKEYAALVGKELGERIVLKF